MYAFNRRNFLEAINLAEKELRINKHHGPCFALLGQSSMQIYDFEHAKNSLDAAVYLEPENATYLLEQGKVYYHLGEFQKAIDLHNLALGKDPENVQIAAEAAGYSDYLGDAYSADRKSFYTELKARAEKLEVLDNNDISDPRHPGDKIVVGYICNFAFAGPESRMLEAVLRHHNLDKFDIKFYQQSIVEDSVSSKLKMYTASSRKIFDLEEEVLSIIMKADGLDILVDLCGFSTSGRTQLMAMKIASVQISWLQSPFGINVPGNNFILSDPFTIDSDRNESTLAQTSLMLDSGIFTSLPFDIMPELVAPPASTTNFVTFGGKCDLALLSPETISLWATVLKSVPNSILLLGNVISCSRLEFTPTR